MSDTLSRKIMYYHLRNLPTLWDPRSQIDIVSILEHVNTLGFPFPRAHGRYWMDTDGRTYCCWVDSIALDCCCVRFGKLRIDRTLPSVEEQGTLSSINSVLSEAASIAELMHVVFFPDNIVGAEHNFYGPRMHNVTGYLSNKSLNPISLHSDVLLKHDAATLLQSKKRIAMLRLKVPKSLLEVERLNDNSIMKALRGLKDISDADTIEVVLRRKHTLALPVVQGMASLFQDDTFLTEVDKVEIREEGSSPVDQLSDGLIITHQFEKTGDYSNQLVSQEVYSAIKKGYDLLHESLLHTIGVQV